MNALDLDHVKTINIVDGLATYNPVGLIQIGGAGFRWNGPSLFHSTSTTTFSGSSTVSMQGTMTVSSTGSVVIGSSGEISVTSGGEVTLATGSGMTWEDGSLIQADDGCTFQLADGSVINFGGIVNFGVTSEIFGAPRLASSATLTAQSGAAVTMASGSTLTAASGSTVTLGGATNVTASQPASTADPGANNRLVGTNLVKAWAVISINDGSFTVLDGYNIASVSIDGISNFQANIVFARAMANANYAVTYGVGGAGGVRCYANTSATKSTTGFGFNVQSEIAAANIDLTDTPGTLEVSICVMGRQ